MRHTTSTDVVPTAFLRWAGSKKQILPQLSEYWRPDYKRYIEPFAGSACLFFRLSPPSAVLSDVNESLINALLCVKRDPEYVWKLLCGYSKSESEYYKVRRSLLNLKGDFERAAAFVYLNRFCFNGLYRTNRAGEFNVPYGGDKAGLLPNLETLLGCSRALAVADVVCCDFEETLSNAEAGDFVYIDPPFSVRSRRVFKEYDASLFGLKAILRLKKSLYDLEKRGVSFVLSYAASPEAEFLSSGLSVTHVDVRRTIASFARNRTSAREVIATYRAPDMNAHIGQN